MSYTENSPNIEALNIIVGKTVVGTGRLNDGVVEATLNTEGEKLIQSSRDVEHLSIGLAETPERAYVLPEHMDFDA